MIKEINIGDKVHYTSPHTGKKENGIIKSLAETLEGAFVVYHCNKDWVHYCEYTGVYTDLVDLTDGWAEEKEITIYDVLLSRLKAAIDCVNIKDIEGCRYSLNKALTIINENTNK